MFDHVADVVEGIDGENNKEPWKDRHVWCPLQAAHLGDKHAELKVFDYHETLADELQETQLSKTHRVWRNQEVTE